MYGASWCPVCERQLAAFGRAAGYLDHVECSVDGTHERTRTCEAAGVRSYPTWEFRDGSRLSGFVSLPRLAEKTGCALGGASS